MPVGRKKTNDTPIFKKDKKVDPENLYPQSLDDGTNCTLSNCTDGTKLGGVADTPESHLAVQRDLKKTPKENRDYIPEQGMLQSSTDYHAETQQRYQKMLLFLVVYTSILHRKDSGYIAELQKTGNRISIIHITVAPSDLLHGTSYAQT
ncbi:hypothetical protein BTVI_106353 [Pitangus sulphuratus]|nr:hypothetical protein BTVI_106353 [Pitangus sulphuratus]